MASTFEVKAVVQGIKQSGMHKLATTPCSAAPFPIIAFCSGVYLPYWPRPLLLLFESIAERTSELEDEIDVDGNRYLEITPYVLGAEAT